MPRPKPSPDKQYAGRRPNVGVITLAVDKEALALLAHYSTPKTHGALVARLLYEHHARVCERERLSREPHTEVAHGLES